MEMEVRGTPSVAWLLPLTWGATNRGSAPSVFTHLATELVGKVRLSRGARLVELAN